MILRIKVFLLTFALVFIQSCNFEFVDTPPDPPVKPSSIPDLALWVGGLDGGGYVQLQNKLEDNRLVLDGTVYSELGEVIYKGGFRIEPVESKFLIEQFPELLDSWDGVALNLKNGLRLVAVE